MNVLSTSPYSVVSNPCPRPHRAEARRSPARTGPGMCCVRRRGGLALFDRPPQMPIRSSGDPVGPECQRHGDVARRDDEVIHRGASLKMLGDGNATVSSSTATPIPIRLATRMKTVRMSWMRTRRRPGFPTTARVTRSRTPESPAAGRSAGSRLQKPAQPLRGRSRWPSWWRQPNCCRSTRAKVSRVRLVIAHCTVDYIGRLTAHLPSARRLAAVQGRRVGQRACRRPCLQAAELDEPAVLVDRGARGRGAGMGGARTRPASSCASPSRTSNTTPAMSWASIPGLVKDGVEAHLQALLAEHVELLGAGYTLVRREYMTRSGRSTCCAATNRAAQSPSRSSAAGKSTEWSNSPATWICSTGTACWRR